VLGRSRIKQEASALVKGGVLAPQQAEDADKEEEEEEEEEEQEEEEEEEMRPVMKPDQGAGLRERLFLSREELDAIERDPLGQGYAPPSCSPPSW